MKTRNMKIIDWLNEHVVHLILGFIGSLISFFEPVKSVIHLVIFMIFLDFLIGSYVSMRMGCHFESRKAWRTLDKLLLMLTIFLLIYKIDVTFNQFQIHGYVGWFICFIELYSMVESAAKISKRFDSIKTFLNKVFEKKTGIDLKDE